MRISGMQTVEIVAATISRDRINKTFCTNREKKKTNKYHKHIQNKNER